MLFPQATPSKSNPFNDITNISRINEVEDADDCEIDDPEILTSKKHLSIN